MTKLQYINACKASTQCAIAVMDARDTKRKCYDATYKLVVVSRTDQQSMRATAKEFGIDEKQVREWCRQTPELIKMCAEGHGNESGVVVVGLELCLVCKKRLLHSANTASAGIASECIAERHCVFAKGKTAWKLAPHSSAPHCTQNTARARPTKPQSASRNSRMTWRLTYIASSTGTSCVLKLRGWKIGHGVHWQGPSALATTLKKKMNNCGRH